MSVFERIHDQIGDNEIRNFFAGRIVRCLSMLCLLDGPNGLRYMKRAHALDPNDASVLNNLGFILHTQHGEQEMAMNWYDAALHQDPLFEKAYSGAMVIADEMDMPYLRYNIAKRGIRYLPSSPEILNGYGLALIKVRTKDHISLARETFSKALVFAKKEGNTTLLAKVHLNMGHLHSISGNPMQAIEHYIQCIHLDRTTDLAYSNLLLNLHYRTIEDTLPLMSNKKYAVGQAMCKVQQGQRQGRQLGWETVHAAIIDLCKYKRDVAIKSWSYPLDFQPVVAFMTADFVGHAVSCFIECILAGLFARNVKTVLFSNAVLSPMNIQKLKHWKYICINNVSTKDVVSMMHEMHCTTIIDLSGHTNGNRMDVMASLDAFKQETASTLPQLFTYCGYPDNLGFKHVRRITDADSEPSNADWSKLYKLPRLFLCYSPPVPYTRLATKDWSIYKPTGLITMGTFCKLSKISPLCVTMWKRILKQNSSVRLVIKSKFFDDTSVAEAWKQKFGQMQNRVRFIVGTDTSEDHMKLYRMLDLHLDTHPYSGTTITTESLYMDVPVLTLCRPDDPHVSRVSASILKSAGLDNELVATSPDDYINKAKTLIAKLHTLGVREKMNASPLLDHENMVDAFEGLIN